VGARKKGRRESSAPSSLASIGYLQHGPSRQQGPSGQQAAFLTFADAATDFGSLHSPSKQQDVFAVAAAAEASTAPQHSPGPQSRQIAGHSSHSGHQLEQHCSLPSGRLSVPQQAAFPVSELTTNAVPAPMPTELTNTANAR